MKHADIIKVVKELVQQANDPGERSDFRRTLAFVFRQFAGIAEPAVREALCDAAADCSK